MQRKSVRSRCELGSVQRSFSAPEVLRQAVLWPHQGLAWLPSCLSTEFVIEYEESQWEPGNWKELLRVPGNHNAALLKLHGHVDYCFRVSGVNAVGRGPASQPTERYRTPPAGLRRPLVVPVRPAMPTQSIFSCLSQLLTRTLKTSKLKVACRMKWTSTGK